MGWILKHVISGVAIIGIITIGASVTAYAAAPATGYDTSESGTLTAPRLVQLKSGASNSKYLSAHVTRVRDAGLTDQMTTYATNRCPAFVTWEDWEGSRVHAYVDFHPSDLCNGNHVKRTYVRLIRQCGPYYDTGRIYTNTASSTSDTRLYSVSVWIFDSPIWSCNTNTYYGYEYF